MTQLFWGGGHVYIVLFLLAVAIFYFLMDTTDLTRALLRLERTINFLEGGGGEGEWSDGWEGREGRGGGREEGEGGRGGERGRER